MIVQCPCCAGKGEVDDDPPLKLTPVQKRIYQIISRHKLGGHELVEKLYAEHRDGGPDYALDTVHVHIHQMNKRLKLANQKVVATSRGQGATYRIINVV